MSYTEQTGWYHAEGDPLDTKRFWDGTEWSEGMIGGEMLPGRFGARLIDSVITGVILFIIALAFGADSVSAITLMSVSYTHLRAHETREDRGWRGGG